MTTPTTPTTRKTPVSSVLFCKKDLGTSVPMLALPVEEAEAVAVTIIGVPLELEVTTEALPGVEVELVDVVDGVESVDELLELDLRRT